MDSDSGKVIDAIPTLKVGVDDVPCLTCPSKRIYYPVPPVSWEVCKQIEPPPALTITIAWGEWRPGADWRKPRLLVHGTQTVLTAADP